MKNCVFCKIANHQIKKEFEYEDKDLMVFPDLNPARDVHFLIVPKKHLKDFMELKDSKLMAKVFGKIQDMIKKEKLDKKGFKLFLNGGGAQIIDHLHIHLTGPWNKNERFGL
ncbi:MAG TPA: HIT domain-containing protein [Candidatus Sulfotelmatobacter sp.]|nr:HIT domain-containing protein [Candidatus Sulfotelmatobacter sp.]